ncbi:MAG: hypothetical protein AAGF84_09830 [Planctomycetota bacterium]
MKFQKFIGLRAFVRTSACTGLALAGLAVSMVAAPEANAQFIQQYDTTFDTRPFEFDPSRERIISGAGGRGEPQVISREDLIDVITFRPIDSNSFFTPAPGQPIVIEEAQTTVTRNGRLVAIGRPGRVFIDDEDRFILVPPPSSARFARPLPNDLVTPTEPFDTAFLAIDGALQGATSRNGQEVRFNGRVLDSDPVTLPVSVRNTLLAAQTTTNLQPNASRYLFSTDIRIDQMERRSPNTLGADTGFFINVDLGNAGSGDFTVEFANEFRGRTNPDGTRYSIFLTNSESGTRRRIGSYAPGEKSLNLAMQITAATGRLRLTLDGTVLKQANIDLDTSSPYSPVVTMSLIDTINVNARSAFSSVSLESLQSYYNPEPGTVMLGMAGMGLLLRRRR